MIFMVKNPNFILIGDPFFSETPCYSEQIENEKNIKARNEFKKGMDEANKEM